MSDEYTDNLPTGEHSQDPQDVSAHPTKFYSSIPARTDQLNTAATTKGIEN